MSELLVALGFWVAVMLVLSAIGAVLNRSAKPQAPVTKWIGKIVGFKNHDRTLRKHLPTCVELDDGRFIDASVSVAGFWALQPGDRVYGTTTGTQHVVEGRVVTEQLEGKSQ